MKNGEISMSKNKLHKNRTHRKISTPAMTPDKQVQKPNRKRNNAVITAAILCITLIVIVIANSLHYNKYTTGMTGATVNYEIGRVVTVTAESLQDSSYQKGLMTGSQTVSVKILTGKHAGETVTAQNALSTYNSIVAKAGKYLIVTVDQLDSGKFDVRVYNYFRAPFIYLMGLVFLIALFLVGGKKGLMSGFGLIYTFVCVLAVFLPLILRGYSPVLASIILVVMVTATSMIFINGAGEKSLCAILGTVGGVLLSGIILFIFGALIHISGFSTDEAEDLLVIGQTTGLQVKDLLFAGILIASLGAIMDTSITIVSAINEVYLNIPGIKPAALIKAGMNVGKDMIGTMANTLILAFTGTSLSLMILMYSYSVQYNQLLNMNKIAIEITQALAGSLGIILTVPLTAVITANVFVKKR